MKLFYPLYFTIIFLAGATGYYSLFDTLGIWQYILAAIPLFLVVLIFEKLNLTEKRVNVGVGMLVFISGPILAIFL